MKCWEVYYKTAHPSYLQAMWINYLGSFSVPKWSDLSHLQAMWITSDMENAWMWSYLKSLPQK